MEQLIPLREHKGKRTIYARDLHSFLEIASRFNDWIRNRIEKYDFIEGQDFETLTKSLVSGGTEKDYVLTLDCAKELAMVEANDKGKLARRYFIECEKKLQEVAGQMASIAKHTKRPVQIQNSKDVNAHHWNIGGQEDIITYNREHCLKVSGYTPSQLKELAKAKGMKSKLRSSGKEVLRNLKPEIACRMSLNDDLVKYGTSLEEACQLTASVAPLFAKMIQLGMSPAELRA